ncbi:MAG: hypothetical protein ACR2NM_16990, partial [Bythopirellula sp.]
AVAFVRNLAQVHAVSLPLLIVSSIVGHGLLADWYVTRFGMNSARPEKFGIAKKPSHTASVWVGPPWRSMGSAIVWKQVCETGPLAVVAAVGVLAISGLGYWFQDQESPLRNEFAHILSSVTVSVGFLVTVVAGIGVFLEDLKPQVGVFWRSRPIRFQQWFWIKYIIGMLILVATFSSLLLLAYGLLDQRDASELLTREFRGAAVVVSLVFLLLYTLAIAAFGWTRHPVLAAMLTIGLFFLGVLVVELIYNHQLSPDATPAFRFAALGAAWVGAACAAHSAVRHNWSWHR